MEQQLAAGTMRNVRHLWTSVRPNGDDRPHQLNRLELRICDLVADPALLLAITAYCELRLLELRADPDGHDPLLASQLGSDQLAVLADANDRAAARSSLEAELRHWRDGSPIAARTWITAELERLRPLAATLGLSAWLAPLEPLLRPLAEGGGNQAQRWLHRHGAGEPIAAILAEETAALERRELELAAWLATDRADTLG